MLFCSHCFSFNEINIRDYRNYQIWVHKSWTKIGCLLPLFHFSFSVLTSSVWRTNESMWKKNPSSDLLTLEYSYSSSDLLIYFIFAGLGGDGHGYFIVGMELKSICPCVKMITVTELSWCQVCLQIDMLTPLAYGENRQAYMIYREMLLHFTCNVRSKNSISLLCNML